MDLADTGAPTAPAGCPSSSPPLLPVSSKKPPGFQRRLLSKQPSLSTAPPSSPAALRQLLTAWHTLALCHSCTCPSPGARERSSGPAPARSRRPASFLPGGAPGVQSAPSSAPLPSQGSTTPSPDLTSGCCNGPQPSLQASLASTPPGPQGSWASAPRAPRTEAEATLLCSALTHGGAGEVAAHTHQHC